MLDSRAGWILTYPELSTRCKLVAEMRQNKRLAHWLFRVFNIEGAIAANILDPKIKTHVLDAIHKTKVSQLERFRGELEAKDKSIFNELAGVLRNFYANLIGPPYKLRREHDVKVERHNQDRK